MKASEKQTVNRAVSRSLKQLEPELELDVEGLTPSSHSTLTAQRQPQRPISHYAAPPFASPEYEPWLDETLAIIRRVATLAQIEWHREQLAQLAGRLEA